MTGLDLDTFLNLLRADLGTWAVLGLGTIGLALVVWSCYGSRRALRKCLVLSLAAHFGLVLYGSTIPSLPWALRPDRRDAAQRAHIRNIKVSPATEASAATARDDAIRALRPSQTETKKSAAARWDLVDSPVLLANAAIRPQRPQIEPSAASKSGSLHLPQAPVAVVATIPQAVRPVADGSTPEPRADLTVTETDRAPMPQAPPPANLAAADPAEDLPAAAAERETEKGAPRTSEPSLLARGIVLQSDRRLRPDRSMRNDDTRLRRNATRPARSEPRAPGSAKTSGEPGGRQADGRPEPAGAGEDDGSPVALVRATPRPSIAASVAPVRERAEGRGLPDIPKLYQPRLEPDRSARAQRSGASAASELAVERALDWLARHQDPDGRWDGGVARYDDGSPAKGDDDFTVHCPPGETCFGECAYWEADTALSALALLTYLGAGYTHTEGRYSDTVGKGIDFLLKQQHPDGDLRGRSRVVGMYCHAMATLSLCEAYALTGDGRLRDPAERAVNFLVRARARDGLAWRYEPGAPVGDTSILGWVVMGLKSAREVGIPTPNEASIRQGTLRWLDQVAAGQSKGLARYQPADPVTPTMTAEAWVCRQFLGVGGPGLASSEAARFLLQNESDRGPTNVYYWYYATLALYQHGGEDWDRWNAKIRDRIVELQCKSGHQTGSWGPDGSIYGAKGGRIYCTALAALTLEVYYRYLRLYDDPKLTTFPTEPSRSRP
ncbi:MAG: hypothetical protein ACLQIB_31150 [Isosphaeraceae bacterium]